MLSPAFAASCSISPPRDFAALSRLRDNDWPRWFAEMFVKAALRFAPVRDGTQELAAAAVAV